MRIELVQGDITTRSADAIVNAANPSLLGGGGVDGAIHRAGGPSIIQECRRLRAERYPDGLPAGRAVATGAGALDARWVIHTVGPVYREDPAPAATLASCYTSSLQVADELDATSVAFPAISTGAFGYPAEEAAEVALAALMNAATSVQEIEIVLFEERNFRVFEETLTRTRA